jgi:hypothetical protein
MNSAVYLLANKCMARKGLSWPQPVGPIGHPRSPNERRYGIIDSESAQDFGYQVPPPLGATRAQEAQQAARNVERQKLLTDTLISAYAGNGRGQDGCRGEARRELGLSYLEGTIDDPVAEVSGKAWAATVADPSAKRVDREWSLCMSRHGYRYPDPHQAAGAWKPKPTRDPARPIDPPSHEEVEMALTDIKCKAQVNYVERWQHIETEHQRLEMRPRLKDLDAMRERWQNAAEKCRKTLESYK